MISKTRLDRGSFSLTELLVHAEQEDARGYDGYPMFSDDGDDVDYDEPETLDNDSWT